VKMKNFWVFGDVEEWGVHRHFFLCVCNKMRSIIRV